MEKFIMYYKIYILKTIFEYTDIEIIAIKINMVIAEQWATLNKVGEKIQVWLIMLQIQDILQIKVYLKSQTCDRQDITGRC